MTGQTFIITGEPWLDNLLPSIRDFLSNDVLDVLIDGKKIRGYRSPDARSIWIRDYSDMIRGFRYFERDVCSAVEHFAENQAANGRIFDYFTTFPEKLPCERENWTKYVRVPVEADVEYRFVKAAYLAWQACGDDVWIEKLLPSLERALQYVLAHPWRTDPETGLIKRAYTIDTWDFAYTAGKHDWLQFQIDEDTYWGIMHGDNSGYAEAFTIMSRLCSHFNRRDEAEHWRRRAEQLCLQMNKTCWNGSFYTHFVKLTPVRIAGVDENAQLSLSNPMNINRGVTTQKQAVSILREYQNRRQSSEAFAEWFSIDPPFPDGIFGDELLRGGAYCNGGIMPLVGGELARAAFEHGFESYGVDILQRYSGMIGKRGETHLWYFPEGTPAGVETSTSPEAQPTDGWGSSAMLYALVEGLAGIVDMNKGFDRIRLSPRWNSAGIDTAEINLVYPASESQFGYSYRNDGKSITIQCSGGTTNIEFHVMLPGKTSAEIVEINGVTVPHRNVSIEDSSYVDFEAGMDRTIEVHIQYNSAE